MATSTRGRHVSFVVFVASVDMCSGAFVPLTENGHEWCVMKFGPDRRVRKHPEFQAIQRKGRRVATAHFVLIVAPVDSPDSLPRLGITASRKVGNAVRRNRLKRLVRAAFRETGGWVPPGYDLVVICKADNPALDTQTVVQEWKQAESRLKRALNAPGGPRRLGKPMENRKK